MVGLIRDGSVGLGRCGFSKVEASKPGLCVFAQLLWLVVLTPKRQHTPTCVHNQLHCTGPGGAPHVHCMPVVEGMPLVVALEDVLPLSALLVPVGAYRDRLMQVRALRAAVHASSR